MSESPLEAEIVIERVAAGGDGVGHWADGRVVFVPRSAPGDRVVVRVVAERPRYLKAQVSQLLEPSPDRVAPECEHYAEDHCGGCQLQHLAPPAQLAAKRRIVGDALRRLGKIDRPDPPIEPADANWGYRRKITLTRAGSGEFGFYRAPAGSVFPLRSCPVAAPRLTTMWHLLRAHPEVIPETARRLVLRQDGTGGLHLAALEVADGLWARSNDCSSLLERGGVPATLWLAAGAESHWVAGPEPVVPGLAFEQVNPVMGERIRGHAVAALGPVAGRHVWDLYAGIGQTAALLAAQGARVSAVELAGDAVAAAAPVEGVSWFPGRVEQVISRLNPPDLVVANPPRTGLAGGAANGLSRSSADRIVYVSCDPATMARDCRRLADRFAVVDVRAYDLFPQTAHVECLARLERR